MEDLSFCPRTLLSCHSPFTPLKLSSPKNAGSAAATGQKYLKHPFTGDATQVAIMMSIAKTGISS